MLYEDPAEGHRIEIDLGCQGAGDSERVNFVGFGVPYAFLGASGRKVLELAFAVASHLGWRLYDPQNGRYCDASDEAVLIASQASALGAVDQISREGLRPRRSFLGRVLERLMRQTTFTVAIAVLAFGMIGVYAGWTEKSRQRQDPRGFVGMVLGAALAAVLLRPLILELIEPSEP
jgi:hypothetical protein